MPEPMSDAQATRDLIADLRHRVELHCGSNHHETVVMLAEIDRLRARKMPSVDLTGTVHELKCEPPYFEAVASGLKTFEVRYADRNFGVGDELHLREYVPSDPLRHVQAWGGRYTGRECRAVVTYLLRDPRYVAPGSVALSISILGDAP